MAEINKKIDEVIVKIWDMSSASQEPVVRQVTLEWAREELRQLFPQPLDDKELREKLALNLPILWCDECPYKETMHLCIEGKACRWQLDYADQILSLLPQQKIEEARRQGVNEVVDYFSRHWMGATKGMLIYEIPDKDRQLLEEGVIPAALKGGE